MPIKKSLSYKLNAKVEKTGYNEKQIGLPPFGKY